jgi:hypothetical protein
MGELVLEGDYLKMLLPSFQYLSHPAGIMANVDMESIDFYGV